MDKPDFEKCGGLIPAITQDEASGEVLMLAYMNEDAWNETLRTGEVHYYSRSRKERWHKGATSGEFQDVIEIRTDCDQDALILRVKQRGGGCCHTSRSTCFYRKVALPAEAGVVMLEKV